MRTKSTNELRRHITKETIQSMSFLNWGNLDSNSNCNIDMNCFKIYRRVVITFFVNENFAIRQNYLNHRMKMTRRVLLKRLIALIALSKCFNLD